jgi:type II secretory pathway component PulK
MLLILSLLSVGMGYRLATRLRLINYQIDDLHAQGLVNAGFRLGLWKLNENNGQTDALNQDWANDPQVFKNYKFADGSVTIGYQTERDKDPITYGMIDEESKININTASYEVLMRLPGMTSSLVYSIIDWRDKDNVTSPDGAENSYYQTMKKPYSCKNDDFEFIDELLLVKGCTSENLAQFRDLITVYGSGKVNINTAPRSVLKAIGLSDTLADVIIGYRQGIDGMPGTKDDHVFLSIASINAQLNEYKSLTVDETTQLNNMNNMLTTVSTYFSIPIQVDLAKGGRRNVMAVVDKRQKRIVYWSES